MSNMLEQLPEAAVYGGMDATMVGPMIVWGGHAQKGRLVLPTQQQTLNVEVLKALIARQPVKLNPLSVDWFEVFVRHVRENSMGM